MPPSRIFESSVVITRCACNARRLTFLLPADGVAANDPRSFIRLPEVRKPRMRRRRATLLAVFLGLLLFWSAFPADRAQTAGSMTIAADYELIGSSQLSGGGHIT